MKKHFTLFGLFLFLSIIASAQSTASIVISQVYGGGGNTGAPYQNDFIELYNRSSNSVTLNGYSIQYASATGAIFTAYNLPGITLQPGQYYLIGGGSGGAVGSVLPTVDFTISQNLSATVGRVALSSSTTALSGTTCFASGTVVDLIGYGATAACYEGAGPAPAPSNTTADIRGASGTLDGNNNNLDFTTAAPNPRNTSSPFGPILPLPIKLGYFSAVKGTRSIDIKWRTLNEESLASFSIERSKEGSSFITLATLPSSGTPNDYTYTDNDPLPVINYYRLKAVSRNGSITYSSILSVKMNGKDVVEVYPNPTKGLLTVQFTSRGQEKLQVLDASGRIVKTVSIIPSGSITTSVDVADLTKGIYFIQAGTQHLQFVKL